MMLRLNGLIASTLLAVNVLATLTPVAAQELRFANGFPGDETFFPIGVWLQNPRTAMLLRTLGINTYVALWKGPTEAQLTEIAKAGMYAVAEQTEAAATLPSAHVIRAWLQPDEPDNAQRLIAGYGDCVMPDEIYRRYDAMRARDPSRPVLLNFGQGVANKGWRGRGTACARLDHETYYLNASQGGDILSFDFYPATDSSQPAIYGKLDLVAEGVTNLKRWAGPDRSVWNVIGTTHINDSDRRPTPTQVRSQVWTSLIAGSRGIVYFLHEWKPTFREDAIFRYPEIVREVARLNAEIEMLAPVLNARVAALDAVVESPVRVSVMARQVADTIYVFAAALEARAGPLKIKVPGLGTAIGVAIGEDRPVLIDDGVIEDQMPSWGVRLYKVTLPRRAG